MKDKAKTKAQLIQELTDLRHSFSELERKYNEMTASMSRYREFVDNVSDACVETDLAGNVTFSNAIRRKVWGG